MEILTVSELICQSAFKLGSDAILVQLRLFRAY